MYFEWHESKRRWVLEERGIDFIDVQLLFDGRPVVTRYSPRGHEERWATTGLLADKMTTVIWTRRGDAIRLISARRARDHEQRAYRTIYG